MVGLRKKVLTLLGLIDISLSRCWKRTGARMRMLSEVVWRMTGNWVIQMATDGQGGAAHSQMV